MASQNSGSISRHIQALFLFAGLFLSGLSVVAQTRQPVSKGSTLLVDTDDLYNLYIDGDDKGVQSPEQSQQLKVGPGDHILDCSIKGVPDPVWRKDISVKDSSQVAAVIALNTLHLQYDEALAKAKSQKNEADSAAARKLQEAETEEKQRKTANAAVPQQPAEIVQGRWRGAYHVDFGGEEGSETVGCDLNFGPLDNGAIVVTADEGTLQMTVVPVAPNLLISEHGWVTVKFNPHDSRWKELVDANGFATCASHPEVGECHRDQGNRIEISITNKGQVGTEGLELSSSDNLNEISLNAIHNLPAG